MGAVLLPQFLCVMRDEEERSCSAGASRPACCRYDGRRPTPLPPCWLMAQPVNSVVRVSSRSEDSLLCVEMDWILLD